MSAAKVSAAKVDIKKSALLVMDMQTGIVAMAPDPEALTRNVGVALKAARQAGMTVIHVGVGFRNGFPEIGEANKVFSGLKHNKAFQDMPHHPDTAPQGDEPLIVKRRVSAFYGSDLDILLRVQGIDTLYLTGFATSGVVLSTVRAGADADYRLNVLSDCCADFKPEVQDALMNHVFPMQATVLTSAAFVAAVTGSG